MGTDVPTSETKDGPALGRSVRGARWLASRKLWIVAVLLVGLAIVVSVVAPARHRLMDLRYLEQRGIEYEFSSRNEWMTERFGDWALAFRYVERVNALEVNDEDLVHISHLKEVENLHCALNWTSPAVRHRSVTSLRSMTELRVLSLAGNGFTDDALAELLAPHPPLEALGLHGTGAARETLKSLSRFNSVTYLVLNGKYPDDADFAGLSPPTNLQVLFMFGGQRGDIAARWIAKATELKSLQFAHNQITNDGLREIASLSNVECLMFYECPHVTFDGLACLEAMPSLRELRIPADLITPATVEILHRIPHLERVGYYGEIDNPDLQRKLESEWPDVD